MEKKKISIDKSVCIGCGCCAGTYPDDFKIGDSGLAEVVAGEAEEAEAVATVGDLSTGECEGVLVGGSHLDTSRRIPVVAVHLAQDK